MLKGIYKFSNSKNGVMSQLKTSKQRAVHTAMVIYSLRLFSMDTLFINLVNRKTSCGEVYSMYYRPKGDGLMSKCEGERGCDILMLMKAILRNGKKTNINGKKHSLILMVITLLQLVAVVV